MNKKDAAVLDIIKISLSSDNGHVSLPEIDDYDAVFQELKDQAVITLTAEMLNLLPINDELRHRWQKTVFQYIYYGTILRKEEERVLQLLNEVEVCIIKGSAAAVYYPNPFLRTFGDIDLLVQPKDFQHCIEILIGNGYQNADPNRPTGRNIQLRKKRFEVELHQSYFGGRFMQTADRRDEKLFDAMHVCEFRQIGEHTFPMFDDVNNGMILLHHFHRHIIDGVGIRHLIDWMMFVSAVCDDNYWNNTFMGVAEQLDLVIFAKTITRMCQLYLGLSNTITWCQGANDEYCESFMEYLFQKGNFGKKSKRTGDELVLSKLTMHRNIKDEWKQLKEQGIENWPKAKKYPILKKVAWVHQIMIYIRKIIRMKAFGQLFKQKKKAALRNKMFRDFHVIK